jgi:hypothetical protein
VESLTVLLDLDQLNDQRAVLVHRDPSGGPSLVTLTLRRSVWEDLGRPDPLPLPLHASGQEQAA